MWESGIISKDSEGNHVMKSFYIFVGSPYFTGGRKPSYKVYGMSGDTVDKHASEMKIVDASACWIDCPLCRRLSLGTAFYEVRDVRDEVVEEAVECQYCSLFESRKGEDKVHDGYSTWCDDFGVHTTRLGFILSSDRLAKAYATARRFRPPRGKRT